MEKKLTVVYDDKCPMCSAGMRVSEALDKEHAVEFVGMNTERGKELVRLHSLDMNKSAYAFHRDGTKTEKSKMLRNVLEHNGLVGFLISLVFRIPYLNDKFYGCLAWMRWHITRSKK